MKFVFHSWTLPLFIKGHKKDLDYEDLYKCSKKDETDIVCAKLEKYWN